MSNTGKKYSHSAKYIAKQQFIEKYNRMYEQRVREGYLFKTKSTKRALGRYFKLGVNDVNDVLEEQTKYSTRYIENILRKSDEIGFGLTIVDIKTESQLFKEFWEWINNMGGFQEVYY